MNLLHHGVDRSVIALWLGHESVETTSIYLQADMELKERALAKTEATLPRLPLSTQRSRISLPQLSLIIPPNDAPTLTRPADLRTLVGRCRNNPVAGIMAVIPLTELATPVRNKYARAMVSIRSGSRDPIAAFICLPWPCARL